MSDSATKQSGINLNTILLLLLTAVGGWTIKTTFDTSIAVSRLELLVGGSITKLDVEIRLGDINTSILNLRARIAEMETSILQLKRDTRRELTSPKNSQP